MYVACQHQHHIKAPNSLCENSTDIMLQLSWDLELIMHSFVFRFALLISVLCVCGFVKAAMSCKWADMSIKVWQHSVCVTHEYIHKVLFLSFFVVMLFLVGGGGLCCVGPSDWRQNRCWGWRHGRCFECRELALGRRPRALLGRQVVQIWSPRSSTASGTLNLRYCLNLRPLWETPAVCSRF